MTENATLKLNSPARRTNLGDDRNVFLRNGCVMAIRIVLMVLTRTRHFITAQHRNHALMINSLAKTDVVSIKDGLVIMIMTAVMDRMKESSATLNTRPARLRSSLARTSNVSEINIDAVRKFFS